MKKILILLIGLLSYSLSHAQTLPDRIVIIYGLYTPEWIGNKMAYSTQNFVISKNNDQFYLDGKRIDLDKIKELCREIENPESLSQSFYKSGIDTSYIKRNPLKLKSNYKEYQYSWNTSQLNYIKKELSNIDNYIKEYGAYLNYFKGASIPPRDENGFTIETFIGDSLVNKIVSNKAQSWRFYQFPWIDVVTNKEYYNLQLGELIIDILRHRYSNNLYTNASSKPGFLRGGKLLNYLSDKMIQSRREKLLELSVDSYKSEIEELADLFTIKYAAENVRYGGYTGGGKVLILRLHNDKMLPNVFVEYQVGILGKTLYPRDSLKREYQNIVEKVQSVKFINRYLTDNKNSKLYIYYFNNSPINEYVYKHVRRNCVTKYLEEAITFEIVNENNDSSLWLCFPDNKCLLFRMDGDKVLEYPYILFGDRNKNLYLCQRFDEDGNMIDL